MLFSGWDHIGRILLVAPLCYFGLVLLLRIAGKRSLAKLNAFDFVVTIALGSALSTTILSQQTSLAEGFTALAVMLGLQWLVSWSSVRWRAVRRLVKNDPVLLFHRGEFMSAALSRERVTHEEVLAALRSHGIPAIERAGAVVLETDGTLSVWADGAPGRESSLDGVRGVRGR